VLRDSIGRTVRRVSRAPASRDIRRAHSLSASDGESGPVLRPREREKVAKPDEGRWDETIPAGKVFDLFAKHHSIARHLRRGERLPCRFLEKSATFRSLQRLLKPNRSPFKTRLFNPGEEQ